LQVKGSALVAEYHSGKKEKFSCIPYGDRGIIKRFNLQADASDQPSAQPQRNHLCPNCMQLLPKGVNTCPACGLPFKNRATALKYSLLLPGGGYFYTGHPFMGAGDAVVEAYLILLALGTLCATLLGDPQGLSGFIGVGLILVLEKLLTVYHSNGFLDEFIPVNLKALTGGQPVQNTPTELPPPPPIPEQKRRVEDVLSVR
jgi:hypothetical protein